MFVSVDSIIEGMLFAIQPTFDMFVLNINLIFVNFS